MTQLSNETNTKVEEVLMETLNNEDQDLLNDVDEHIQ